WKDEKLYDDALAIAKSVTAGTSQDRELDLANGEAGLLCALCILIQATSAGEIKGVARKHADHLLQLSIPMDAGAAWKKPLADPALTGFAHGASGIAHALLQFAAIDPDPRYVNAAKAAIAYETSQKLPNQGNWRDLRNEQSAESANILGWCHGAPGIGLSRLAAASFLDDCLDSDIATAIRTTVGYGLGKNHCLCHGNLALLNFLFEASLRRNDGTLREHVFRSCSAVLEMARKEGWGCDAPGNAEVPGFMLGISGVGYSLLRFACPEAVPCVCLAE